MRKPGNLHNTKKNTDHFRRHMFSCSHCFGRSDFFHTCLKRPEISDFNGSDNFGLNNFRVAFFFSLISFPIFCPVSLCQYLVCVSKTGFTRCSPYRIQHLHCITFCCIIQFPQFLKRILISRRINRMVHHV